MRDIQEEQEQETTPLLFTNNTELSLQQQKEKAKMIKKDAIFGTMIQIGLALFVGLIISVLVRLPYNVFIYHAVFMVAFVVLSTEGIFLLQPTSTPKEKEKGLKKHATFIGLSYLCAIGGFSAIMYHKAISHKDHFTSYHGKLGLIVFCFLLFQFLFGLTMAFIPNLFGSVAKAKSLWKYHRMTGYTLIIIVWVTTQLGIRADYIYNNLWSPQLMIGHWIALIFITIGISGRVRLYKWGFSKGNNNTVVSRN